jgi:hypothetical protein
MVNRTSHHLLRLPRLLLLRLPRLLLLRLLRLNVPLRRPEL